MDFHVYTRDRRDQKFWYDTDIDTFAGSKSIPRLIPILSISLNRDRYWHWYQKNVPGLILIPRLYLIRNCCIWPKNWCRWLDRYRYWYRDPRNAPIETDTDTTALGIGVFDTIPIFPSVSAIKVIYVTDILFAKHNLIFTLKAMCVGFQPKYFN